MSNAVVSERQKIGEVMLIIVKLKRFQINIQTWTARDLAEKIWDNFKDSFRSMYNSLRDLVGLTLG